MKIACFQSRLIYYFIVNYHIPKLPHFHIKKNLKPLRGFKKNNNSPELHSGLLGLKSSRFPTTSPRLRSSQRLITQYVVLGGRVPQASRASAYGKPTNTTKPIKHATKKHQKNKKNLPKYPKTHHNTCNPDIYAFFKKNRIK